MSDSRKQELVNLIIADLQRELDAAALSASAAREAATHEESKAEDSHDTRGVEASYLAGAQMARIETLKKVIADYQRAQFKDFKPTDAIDLGALVELELDGKRFHYFLVGQGGGISVVFQKNTVQVITPQAPMGDALLDKRVGDVVEVEGQKVSREYEVIAIS